MINYVKAFIIVFVGSAIADFIFSLIFHKKATTEVYNKKDLKYILFHSFILGIILFICFKIFNID